MKPDASGSYDPSAVGDPTAMIMGMMGTIWIVVLVICVFMIFCYWRIFSKAGYPGALSLLMLVPLANLILFIWFAFADWPVVRQAKGQAPAKT
jgi:heme/copper-type cytochrome/quinol oxidase subunit 2